MGIRHCTFKLSIRIFLFCFAFVCLCFQCFVVCYLLIKITKHIAPSPTPQPTPKPIDPTTRPTSAPTCICNPSCYNTASSDSYTNSDSLSDTIPAKSYSGTPITDFYNELVKIPRMDSLADVESAGWDRTNCPHEENNLYEWHDPDTWDNNNYQVPTTDMDMIRIPDGKSVIIRACSSFSADVNANNPYKRIYIPSSSRLIFDDADMDWHFQEIFNNGTLSIGSPTCRLYSKINFYVYGKKSESSVVFSDFSESSKGILSLGTLNIHGKQFHPTWTKLAYSAGIGDDRIYLQESVNWEVGQEIVVITSIWTDYPDEHENERRIIKAIGDSDWTDRNVIYFGDDNRLDYFHYAGEEYQTEVQLLSRNIKVIGVDDDEDAANGEGFGAHIASVGHDSLQQIQGVENVNGGQLNIMARYVAALQNVVSVIG